MTITDYLNKIRTAVFGRDVREAIASAIETCYNDATGKPESISAAVAEIENYKAQIDSEVGGLEESIEAIGVYYEKTDNVASNHPALSVNNFCQTPVPAGIYLVFGQVTLAGITAASDVDINLVDIGNIQIAKKHIHVPASTEVTEHIGGLVRLTAPGTLATQVISSQARNMNFKFLKAVCVKGA